MSRELYKQIKNYIPFNDIEAAEKKSFLQFIEAFGDRVFSRDNLVGHVTVSSWIVNPSKTKVLMAYHNLYDSFAWLGGHSDNDHNLLRVCLKEIEEESGLSNVRVLSDGFFDIDVGSVFKHNKRGVEVPEHLHYNLTFLVEADESSSLIVKEDENSDIKWIKNEDVLGAVSEKHKREIYKRLIKKSGVF